MVVTVGGNEVGEVGGGGGAHAGDEVLVGGHGEAGMAVAESFGDDLDGRAGGDEEPGVGVAQVVEADAWDVGAGEVPVEQLADGLGVHWLTVAVGEDGIVEVARVTVTVLRMPPSFEDLLGAGVEVDAIVDWCGS